MYILKNGLFNRTMHSGGYDKEEKAARAYDLAALKYWGPSTTTNFPVSYFKFSWIFVIVIIVDNIVSSSVIFIWLRILDN